MGDLLLTYLAWAGSTVRAIAGHLLLLALAMAPLLVPAVVWAYRMAKADVATEEARRAKEGPRPVVGDHPPLS